MHDQFDDIDNKVICFMCEADKDGTAIMNQYVNSVRQREVNPVGWFTNFQVNNECARIPADRKDISNVAATVRGMELGVAFVLHINNGIISFFEASTYEGNLPETIDIISLKKY